ncbi:ATP-binding protein [Deinococcus sonorensis]|uniref:ATP-binding protein n=2 Tax=Deinococcus sonorensis TaxID=309891 RepID=A0AAU7U4Y9_9DEIO
MNALLSRWMPLNDPSAVGAARRMAVEAARQRGADEQLLGRLALIVTELGTNVVRHAGGGQLLLSAAADGPGLEVLTLDRGPGIEHLPSAMRDGYSTQGSAGNGLGGVGRLADLFDVYSDDQGTVFSALVGSAEAVRAHDVGVVVRPHPNETVSGDHAYVVQDGPTLCLTLLDGLGHGPAAALVTEVAGTVLAGAPVQPLARLQALHLGLRDTRGAVAAVVTLNGSDGVVAGLGNISVTCQSVSAHRTFVMTPGTLGHQWTPPREQPLTLTPGEVLVMHSDGVQTRWRLDRYPGLAQRRAIVIAAVLLRDLGRGPDDASVAVVKVRP